MPTIEPVLFDLPEVNVEPRIFHFHFWVLIQVARHELRCRLHLSRFDQIENRKMLTGIVFEWPPTDHSAIFQKAAESIYR